MLEATFFLLRGGFSKSEPIRSCLLLSWLIHHRANLKNFPKSTVPSTLAILFHLGIAAVLTFRFKGTESRLKGSFENAKSLTDFYYSIRGLVLLKTSEVDVQLGDADRIFRSIKALGQSDGRWRLSSNNPQFSNSAAGNALGSPDWSYFFSVSSD